MSNPFELAIFALKRELGKAAIDDPCPICSYEAAIRVLEAAGGFTADDKERIANALDNIPYYTPIADYKCPGQVLRDKFKALLAALPEVKT